MKPRTGFTPKARHQGLTGTLPLIDSVVPPMPVALNPLTEDV